MKEDKINEEQLEEQLDLDMMDSITKIPPSHPKSISPMT